MCLQSPPIAQLVGPQLDPCSQESGGVQPGASGFVTGPVSVSCPDPGLSRLSVELDLFGSGPGLAAATIQPGLAPGV